MFRGTLRSAWIIGLAIASVALSTAAHGAPGHCRPCNESAAGCCGHESADEPHRGAGVAPADDGHCECRPQDCEPPPASEATLPGDDVVVLAEAPVADVARAPYSHPPRPVYTGARAPPRRTVVLLL